uniref:Interferon stimulated exonuclease gene n=1 Tax=Oryzias latipes TaxID=8090 RepID=A0A3B3HN37_ORYLA
LVCRTSVVALDCEMVGTGTGGRVSELGRCSILDYHGNVLYDKYVRPCQPVTNFRTRWSGIRRHHMRNATPFSEAREEILKILEDKVIVGHSIYNDFKVLDIFHPAHMVRDTSMTRHLSRLAGFPRGRCSSLRILSRKLLKRNIQVGKKGHCSVEDATAALDLYKFRFFPASRGRQKLVLSLTSCFKSQLRFFCEYVDRPLEMFNSGSG